MEYLRSRGIKTVIPEIIDQVGAHKEKGSSGGRRPGPDVELYKNRSVVERTLNKVNKFQANGW